MDAALNTYRASESVADAFKTSNKAIPCILDDLAASGGDRRPDDLLEQIHQPTVGIGLVFVHQPRVTRDIREENCGQPAFHYQSPGGGQAGPRNMFKRGSAASVTLGEDFSNETALFCNGLWPPVLAKSLPHPSARPPPRPRGLASRRRSRRCVRRSAGSAASAVSRCRAIGAASSAR